MISLKHRFYVRGFLLVLFAIQICFANIDRSDKKVEFVIDDRFYQDEEVMQALNRYAQVVHQKYGVNIRMVSFPSEPILSNAPSLTSAKELKRRLTEAYQDNQGGKLEGTLFIGSLPRAYMEYSYFNPDRQGGRNVYQRWVTEYYFMDLDGVWLDSKKYSVCETDPENWTYCDEESEEPNEILDGHYSPDGKVSDHFEIWMSRVDPYLAVLSSETFDLLYESTNSGQAGAGLYALAKGYLLKWLNKAYENQVSSNHSRKALFTHLTKVSNRESDNFQKFPRGLGSMYPSVDVEYQLTASEYMSSITQDYDWVSFMGHGNPTWLENGVIVDDFLDNTVFTPARVFHLASCSPTANYGADGSITYPSIAAAHLFMTNGGGVAVVGASKTSGDNQFDDQMYVAAPGNFLAEAFLRWVDHRANEGNNYGDESIYDWFYAESYWGDPFVSVDEDDYYDGSNLFMTFDDPNKAWTSSDATLSYDGTNKIGDYGFSLKIEGNGYKAISSPVFENTDINNLTNRILLNVWVPNDVPNPYWMGDVQLFVDIPSSGVYNAWIGIASLNGLNEGWNTVSFDLNENLYNALNGQYNDARFIITLNTNQGLESFRIDNMRFAPRVLARSVKKELDSYSLNSKVETIDVKAVGRDGVNVVVSEAGWVDVTLADLNGRIVAKAPKFYALTGDNFINCDFQNVRPNRYFLVAKQRNNFIGKMIELK